MARYRIAPGSEVEIPTLREIGAIIPRPKQVTRIRAAESILLDSTGSGRDEVYKCPMGYEFEARRIVLSLTGNVPNDPNSGNVALTVGHYVVYLRSGSLIENGVPQYGSTVQIPGVQSWGEQQGPYLQNGEVFEVAAVGLTPSATLSVYLEGLLTRPGTEGDR